MKLENNFEQIVGPHSEEAIRNSEGDLISLSDGRLLLGWTCFTGGYGDFDTANIIGRTSKDNGFTWSEPFELQANVGKVNTMSLSFLRFKEDLCMFFLVKESAHNSCQCYMRKSNDEGITWQDAIKVTSEVGYHVVNNARVILTKQNRIIVPAAFGVDETKGKAVGICYFSDDGGVSWNKSKDQVKLEDSKTGVQEPGLVELSDGSVLMIIRSDKGYIYKSKSKDGGNTWTKPEPMPLITCVSPATIKQIPGTNKLLIVWNPSVFGKYAKWGERWPLCSAISEDEGETWHNIKYLENTPGICHAYTSITFVEDKTYLTYYEWKALPGKHNFEGTSQKLRIINTFWFSE